MNFRDNKGSISIFVLVALLFMTAFLIISYADVNNKSKTIDEQANIISSIYSASNEFLQDAHYNSILINMEKNDLEVEIGSLENISVNLENEKKDLIPYRMLLYL